MKINKKNKLIEEKIYNSKRISDDEALSLFSWDFFDLAKASDFRRKLAIPDEKVGFIVDRIINYTNKCAAKCLFCAYHAKGNIVKPYELTIDQICEKIKELVVRGGTQVMLQGGLCPDYKIDYFVNLVKTIKKRYPQIYLHSFSPAEIVYIAKNSNLTIDEVINCLKDVGLNSIPGASDLLVDRIRNKVAPNKLSMHDWCEVIKSLAKFNMTSTATMTYGMGETLKEKIEHLNVIRDVQDKFGNLLAFIPWSFSPKNTKMDHIVAATGTCYLKIVAISRIFLDNVKNIQAGWLTEGLDLAQIALKMGANDMGGVLTEEVVVKATGITNKTSINQMINIIKDAGKIPFQRDSKYNEIKIY